MKPRATIIEVGPRDGLQAESSALPAAERIALIESLAQAGLCEIEAGAFVSPKAVPAMAGSDSVLAALAGRRDLVLPVLVPNLQGYAAARAAGARRIALFLAASESFSRANIRADIAESVARARPVADAARADGVTVRGYISTVIACPYDGAVAPAAVLRVAQALLELGCDELSLGDTIGYGTPASVKRLLADVLTICPAERLAWHGHDTYGQGIANIRAALDCGLLRFDAAVGGLGGCPYAPGATGNVATEDVVFLLAGEGFETGVDLRKLAEIGHSITARLGRPNGARAGNAVLSKA